MLKISEIRMDYLKQPMGVITCPQFSWILDSDKRSVHQTSYQLQMADDSDFTNILYDSGIITSDESAHVFIEDINLKSAHKYFVRVRAANNYDETSPWSQSANFVSALLSNNEWQACFISAETKEDAKNSKGTYVRKAFQVKGKVKEAYAFTTALGLYKLYLNGKKIGIDELTPGWTSYNKRLLYQTYDITDSLQEGENAIGAEVGAGWYKGVMGFELQRNHYGERTAFLGQFHIHYEDGTTEIIVTDTTWKGSDSPIRFSEIYDGEIYDAALEQTGWHTPGFCDQTWKAVEIAAYDKNNLVPQSGGTVKEIEEVTAKRIFVTPKGDTVIDFGQNMTGWIHFKVKGQKGDKVEINCFEILDADGNVYLDNLRAAKETLVYLCKGQGEETYHPSFTFQGFQYAKISTYPGEPLLENFTAYAVHSDMEQTGAFECSNKDLNQLQHNILWGLKGNFLDVPTDCPQRDERLGWTGDAQIFCRTASFLMNTYTFFNKWLKDVAADQTPEGGVPHVVPDILSGRCENNWLLNKGTHSAAAWADAAVINPWTLYLTFGDKKIIEEQYDSMKAWIDFMRNHSVDGIWNYKLQFGDWVALDAEEGSYFGATPNDLTCTAYYAYSTGLFAKMAKYIGNMADYKTYWSLYEEVVEGFRRHFFDKDGNMTASTQTAHVVALYFNLVPQMYRQKTADTLVKLIEKENGHLVTGFVGTPYICHALSQNGHTKEAYDLLLKDDFPSWLYQVKMGATTIWEHWDGIKPDGTMWSPDMNSFNHYAYGAIGEWLYRVIAGFEIDEENPGYKHAILYPRIGGDLSYVKASYQTIYGKLALDWTLEADTVTLKACVPHNTTATLYLDEAQEVLESDGLHFADHISGKEALVGSGVYTIKFRR
ncbi:alpha-L-rhamnosidase [Cellulosilyticum sp. I15G10I2]|uniref:alpha-L-rhamnosidase n=1 Tax=Cellulosilyticum sp. I15G10I2 TaxID=1892843 RepID=UPI00085C9893|nr:alpha-L-rhamnosidase [Cellulosilyticum sp. I15G10I2]